jgi:ParB-like chromosome segregation protein Spo0J
MPGGGAKVSAVSGRRVMAAVLPHRYEVVDVGAVSEHPDNPRRGDTAAIGESIEANGLYGAIVVHAGSGRILAGNHRWRAARDAGIGKLPAIMVDCDEDTARRILLTDNRTAELAAWDDAALVSLLNELAVSAGGLAGTGYDEAALAAMINEARFAPADGDQPRLDELQPRWCPRCGYDTANDPEGLAR